MLMGREGWHTQAATALSGPPSITVSALSRDTWTSEGFDLPFVEVLLWLLRLLFAHFTKARF